MGCLVLVAESLNYSWKKPKQFENKSIQFNREIIIYYKSGIIENCLPLTFSKYYFKFFFFWSKLYEKY